MGFKLCTSYVIAEPPTSAMLSFKHMTQYVQLSCKTFNLSMGSCNNVFLWRYRSTIHLALRIISQKIIGRCQIWWPCCSRKWSPSTNPSIWICNVEIIPHISIKVRRWLKGCIPVVLGDQHKSEQIVTPFRSQTSRSTAPKPCVSGQGFLLDTWIQLFADITMSHIYSCSQRPETSISQNLRHWTLLIWIGM